MTGRHAFDRLREGMTDEQRANATVKVAALRDEITLAELRQARALAQETLGETLIDVALVSFKEVGGD